MKDITFKAVSFVVPIFHAGDLICLVITMMVVIDYSKKLTYKNLGFKDLVGLDLIT